ncbi:primosomal protein DnaI [Apilactobacillus xinyiensis]|uniref:primosomal protein DnaI n=1 Tax=Apilactobacillus xinyiensis TaxID=2841032 RepID=UPI001C7E0A38|nr:primosomal protein DnaI [Apilactobacillus xinyiensis]
MESVSQSMKQMMSELNGGSDRYRELIHKVLNNDDVKNFLEKNNDSLDKDAIIKSLSKLYEFVSEKNKINSGQASTIPGYEPELKINNHLIDISYCPTEATIKARKQHALQKRIKTLMMPKDVNNASLHDFDMDESSSRMNVLEQALNFIKNYHKTDKWLPGLYIYGSFGIGKTYLLGAIANKLAENGVDVTMLHFPSFAVEMKNSIGNNNVADKIDAIKRASILMLDDIGADSMSSWVRDDILGVILEWRMQNHLPTFFSSNFSMDKLETEHLSVNNRGDDEPLKAKRIMQRIRFLSKEYLMTGSNRRPQ